MWVKETINDQDKLYFFIHIHAVKYDKEDREPFVPESNLTNTPKEGPDKSCDWSKYHSPQETRELRGKEYKFGKSVFKRPEEFFVYSTRARDWRGINLPSYKQLVEHDPIFNDPEPIGMPNNRAHGIIIGNKDDLKLRTIIARSINWEIAPPDTKIDCLALKKALGL
ncbi:hypothetical protein SAMN00777080_3060 [Aquiflexum balticum DSM 16537]|uniref:Uncharacterized protein n=1 Tax=Aquiflexum balticum DSM 16537 TaxID=758820 RepID=A0A1W2H6G4_9BACT|nr:hypothetical protein [Aquiflexum balticum]SMD44439.1 hypothetical protein SAMN00777080_3060 [Aquiflexum balticum DSM 16537]